MKQRSKRAGNGLIIAGIVVLTVGLTIVAFRTLSIPPYWTPVAVGAALIIGGLIVRNWWSDRT